MKKTIYKIHKFLGLTLGGVLFLLALSGVFITYTHELMPRFYSSYFLVTPGKTILPLKELVLKSQTHLGEEKRITNLYAAEDHDEAYMLLFKEKEKSLPSILTIDPYTGSIVGEMPLSKNIFAVMLFLHANLFLGKTGSYFVGIMGVFLVFFIISGIYLWWPRKYLFSKFKRTCKFSKNQTSQRLHHFLGLLLTLPLFLSAVTGYLIIFDHSHSIGRRINQDPPRVEELENSGTCSLTKQLEALSFIDQKMLKNLISIHFCTQKNALMKVSFGLRDKNFLNGYGRIIIDPNSQRILQDFNSDSDPKSWNYKRLIVYPLHTGEFFGSLGRTIVFLSGWGLMGLFLSGLLLSLRRKKRNSF